METKLMPEWYTHLVGDCQAIITECEFNARWSLVQGYHELGERIIAENGNFDRQMIYGQEIVSRLSKSLGVSSSKIYRAMQFARKYPSLDAAPEGKALTWSKVVNKYLPGKEDIKEPVQACRHCELHCG